MVGGAPLFETDAYRHWSNINSSSSSGPHSFRYNFSIKFQYFRHALLRPIRVHQRAEFSSICKLRNTLLRQKISYRRKETPSRLSSSSAIS